MKSASLGMLPDRYTMANVTTPGAGVGDQSAPREVTQWIRNVLRPGDVNGDGTVNAKDVTVLRRYVAGGYGVTVDAQIADVSGDGTVNAKDVTVLRRYVAGGYGVVLG